MAEPRPVNPPTRGRFWRSLGYAFRGVVAMLRLQANARIHAALTVVVVALGFALRVSAGEWCAIVAVIGLVFTAEGLNTAIETLTDLVSPDAHPLAGQAKDVAAGAVLCAAIAAAIIGAIIFLPKLLALL
jgi:diacylglycerol kinase